VSNVAVVGFGNMGKNHARILREYGCNVITVDPDPSSGADYPSQSAAPICKFSVIATPIADLVKEAYVALVRHSHVLVEKPLAMNADDAAVLKNLASTTSKNLFVGYTETFNPAVSMLHRHLPEIGLLECAEATRIGLAAPANSPGAFLDLAVHDLAVLDSLGFRPRSKIVFQDYITLDENWYAVLRAAYGPEKKRTLKITGEHGCFSVDYQAQTLKHNGQNIPVTKAEPLKLELAAFLEGRGVSAESGIRILRWLA
jgi:predicted dehydrogenase